MTNIYVLNDREDWTTHQVSVDEYEDTVQIQLGVDPSDTQPPILLSIRIEYGDWKISVFQHEDDDRKVEQDAFGPPMSRLLNHDEYITSVWRNRSEEEGADA